MSKQTLSLAVLKADLPGELDAAAQNARSQAPTVSAVQGMANTVGALITTQASSAVTAKITSPIDLWGALLQNIYRWTGTTDSAQLPDVYTDFANAKKSGVRGEVVTHARTSNPRPCPVSAVVEQVILLRRQRAPPTTPLFSYRPQPDSPFIQLRSTEITAALRAQALLHGEELGVEPKAVTASCFRTTGAMALLNADVDADKIRLFGRWNSWTMLRYLHLQSYRQVSTFASKMLNSATAASLQRTVPQQLPDDPELPIVANPQAEAWEQ